MYLGIDLGGTNIAIGIVDEKGNIIKKDSCRTPKNCDYKKVVEAMLELSDKLLADASVDKSEIEAVGIGCPGSIDYEKGSIPYSCNLDFHDVPFREEFQKHWNVKVVLENDANAAAYGEYIVNGNNDEVFLAITLGTGVGGGVIINGKIFHGSNGAGAELGHITLVHNGNLCSCGNHGCWETYASVTALVNQTKAAIEANPDCEMAKLAEKRGKVNGRTAFDSAKAGDPVAQAVVDQYINYVADGLVGIVNIFQPNTLLIGGGISSEGEYLLEPIRKHVRKYDYNKLFKPVEIKTATLFNDAGIIGAALAAKNF